MLGDYIQSIYIGWPYYRQGFCRNCGRCLDCGGCNGHNYPIYPVKNTCYSSGDFVLEFDEITETVAHKFISLWNNQCDSPELGKYKLPEGEDAN